jgi:CHAD domain-containing protein
MLNLIREPIARERDDRRGDITALLDSARAERIIRKLERIVVGIREADRTRRRLRTSTTSPHWTAVLDARMARRAQRLAEAIEEAGTVYQPERLHQVRIALKKLRYALELARDARRPVGRGVLSTLKVAQDVLGALQDRQALVARVRMAQAGLMPPDLRVWAQLDALVSRLEEESHQHHARFLAARDRILEICRTLMTGRAALPGRRVASMRRARA